MAVVGVLSPCAAIHANKALSPGARRAARAEKYMRNKTKGQYEPLGHVASVGHLNRRSYSGWKALHNEPHRKINDHKAEHAVQVTARYLNLPWGVVPPTILDSKGASIRPWIDPLESFKGESYAWENRLEEKIFSAAKENLDRIDWESIHSVLLLDFVVGQADRRSQNVFFRVRKGKFTAIALDNEYAFGRRVVRPGPSAYESEHGKILRSAIESNPNAIEPRRLSSRLRDALKELDVNEWKEAMLEAGMKEGAVKAAAERLLLTKEKGLAAIFSELEPQ